MRRGEVWLCTLDPTVGSEIRNTRPCVIVSPDDLNERLRTIIVAPLTTGTQPARFRIPVKFRDKDQLILPDQIRFVDQRRLIKRLGSVDIQTLTYALSILRDMFRM